ncbi:MAG TPA: hypothetical protein VGL81_01915 [Polyangiaceae bacterium]|jgi:hypothetical protein
MQDTAAACNLALVLHGAIVLLLGQAAGYAFFRAINASPQDAARIGMWRMSHAATSMGAVLLLALAPVVPRLDAASGLSAFLVAVLIASTYALSLGTIAAGFSGHRGTTAKGPWSNVLVYGLYLAGALGSTAGGLVLLYVAARSYLRP